MTKEQQKLKAEDLYTPCDLTSASFTTTADIKQVCEHLGQERAMGALKFGIGMKHDGYNLFVLGSTGLGKNTTVKNILAKESVAAEQPSDWCYINNFSEFYNPLVLKIPAGFGFKLQSEMQQLVSDLLIAVPATFESNEYTTHVHAIQDVYKEKEALAFKELFDKAEKADIVILRTPSGYTLGPIKDEKVLSPEEFKALDKEEQEKIQQLISQLEDELAETIRKVPAWTREKREDIKKLDQEMSEIVVGQLVAEITIKYTKYPDVTKFLESVKQDIIETVNDFRNNGKAKDSEDGHAQEILWSFSRYLINVLVDNSQTKGAPVIYEDNPTYSNLIGNIEHISQYGTLLTDFTLIKAGALHRANGGYLVLDAHKVLMSPFSWDALKRVLRAHEIRIESLEKILSFASTTTLQPAPIPLNVKIILTGSRLLYYLLKEYDPEFGLLFKVPADFAEEIDRSADNNELYARLIAGLQKENELAPFTKNAVQRIIEHCSRLLDDSEKLSLHMGNLLDLLREGDYWAKENKRTQVNENDIQQAIDTRYYRLDQMREKVHEQILRGDYLLDTSGEKVAQINALSILQLSDYRFGKPSRITATARLGHGHVIDIERESDLGGSIHSKGVMIISSYLANRYARNQPISLSASLVFEQSYGMIDGDSASAAELCALLSALADIPIQQSFSVTGSVNQYGEIQSIGGVNEKIEGFFDICNARELIGEHGVIIPHSNVKHLMLRSDIRQAVTDNKFSVYSVSTIDQMMELLTGKKAGALTTNQKYPKGTINYLVQKRVDHLNELRKSFSMNHEPEETSVSDKK